MKILFLTDGLCWFRGTQRMFFEAIRCFSSKGCKVLAWGYDKNGETADRIEKIGVQVLKGIESLQDALDFKPDIVNIHRGGTHSDIETRILSAFKAQGAKIIETSVFGRVDRDGEGLIDLSLQISRWDLYRWNRWKGGLRIYGIYLPYIVDTQSFGRVESSVIIRCRQGWDIPETAFVIGRAGKTDWGRLKDSVLSVLHNYPAAYFVSVNDYNGDMPEDLRAHPRVRLIPRLQSNRDLSEFYSSCSVFVNASPFGESFGMVSAEAMACGTPVVATANPECDNAQAEVIVHGVGGLIAANGSDISDALACLIDKPELRDYMAERCRNLIESRYSRDIVCRKLDLAFRAVLSSDPIAELNNGGFETDVPKTEIRALIQNVIGKYRLVPRLFMLQNLNYRWRRIYEAYDALRNMFKSSGR